MGICFIRVRRSEHSSAPLIRIEQLTLSSTSQKGRIIYTYHIIENEGCKYDQRNWLQPPKEGFTKLYK